VTYAGHLQPTANILSESFFSSTAMVLYILRVTLTACEQRGFR